MDRPAQSLPDLETIVSRLASQHPERVDAFGRLIERLRTAFDHHKNAGTSSSQASTPESRISNLQPAAPDEAETPVEGVRFTVDILRGIVPPHSSGQASDTPQEQDEELKAAFQALRIAFGDQQNLPVDDAEFLEFAAQRLHRYPQYGLLPSDAAFFGYGLD
ncbi:hypothetical protein SISNIDRAFT_468757 [Sistotremastrum niveocremeum HHB9708]|uniref:Uncharacterized protein n=1 Tax=Sistotremastrum niveocremeum HHB9708 TaxID=1314777 RepID=A0A164QYW5_9AGAM|nr:hypothetical protein SISNIDRAFT_468757 [Sistotremastrum niveocremeum HHB9708]